MVVKVISTGGTIASIEDDEGARPELEGADMIATIPGLEDELDLDTHQFSNIPSTHITIEQMYELVCLIQESVEYPEVDGVVVTQGTDILEESAYFVDRCYGGDTPVVFTGAMRNPSLASPDGPGNLLASIRTATDEDANSRGVLVTFNDRVHAASYVTKMHSMNLDTFRSPEFGPVGVHDENHIWWRGGTIPRKATLDVDPDRLTNRVAAITATADMPPSTIPAPEDYEAVCLATTGAGHVPPGIVPELKTLTDAEVPVIVTTRCPEGRLATSTYDFPGSERTLQELNCYYSERNLQKTRMETIAAIAADSLEDIYTQPTA